MAIYPSTSLYPSESLYPEPAVEVGTPQLTANGLNLNSAWCQVEDMSPLLVSAGRRGENVVVPGRHGVIRTPRKRYTTADIVLPLHVKGVDKVTGALVANPMATLHANVDDLLRVFHADVVELEYTREDGSTRAATTELMLEPVVVTRERSHPPLARVAVALTVFGAFWRDAVAVSQSISGTSGTVQALTAFEGATAPTQDLLITVFGPCNNPMITVGDRWVKYNGVISAGRQIVMNTETWQLSPGTGTFWTPDIRQVEQGAPGPWLEIDPTVSPFQAVFSHTTGGSASCTIAGRRRYMTP